MIDGKSTESSHGQRVIAEPSHGSRGGNIILVADGGELTQPSADIFNAFITDQLDKKRFTKFINPLRFNIRSYGSIWTI